MPALRFLKSVMALAVTSLLAASARADNPPQDPASPLTAGSEQPGKRIVLLYSGTKYCGRVAEKIAGSEVVLTLRSGEVRRIQSQDVLGVMLAVGLDGPERMVVLANGTMLRGELVEHVPHDHLTLFLAEGVVRRFEWAQLSQVQPIPSTSSQAAKRAQVSYREVQYGGEVVEYVPGHSITLRLDGGEIRRFPLKEVQQIANFEPVRPVAPPALVRVQPFANANVELPYPEVLRETPAERKGSAINLLINGGIFSAIGIGLLTGGIVLFKNVRSGDQDPLGVIFGISLMAIGSTHLFISPILLGVGGYRYTTPND